MRILEKLLMALGSYVAYIFKAIVMIIVAVIRIAVDTVSDIVVLMAMALLHDVEEFDQTFARMLKKIN